MPLTTYAPGDVLTASSLNANLVFAAANPAAKFGQIVQTVKSDTYSQSATSFTDITGYSVSITPTLASSQVLIVVNAEVGLADVVVTLRLVRGATVIYAGTAASNRPLGFGSAANNSLTGMYSINAFFLDSPATTSATTYKVQMLVNAATGFLNRTSRDSDTTTLDARTASSISVIEILA